MKQVVRQTNLITSFLGASFLPLFVSTLSTVKLLKNMKTAKSLLLHPLFSWQTTQLHYSQHLVRSGTDQFIILWSNQHTYMLMIVITPAVCGHLYCVLMQPNSQCSCSYFHFLSF